MEHEIVKVNFSIIYVLVSSVMQEENNMSLQLSGIQFKDSETGEFFTLSLETGGVTVSSGRKPTSGEFTTVSFNGGIICGGGIPRLLEMVPNAVVTPTNETKKD